MVIKKCYQGDLCNDILYRYTKETQNIVYKMFGMLHSWYSTPVHCTVCRVIAAKMGADL